MWDSGSPELGCGAVLTPARDGEAWPLDARFILGGKVTQSRHGGRHCLGLNLKRETVVLGSGSPSPILGVLPNLGRWKQSGTAVWVTPFQKIMIITTRTVLIILMVNTTGSDLEECLGSTWCLLVLKNTC